jgi:hypothetical protein
MKRKNMIDLIQKEIYTAFSRYPNYSEINSNDIDNDARYAANEVMDVIDLFMSPPERVRLTEQESGNTLCSPECSWDEDE